jgi:hypothetical protein
VVKIPRISISDAQRTELKTLHKTYPFSRHDVSYYHNVWGYKEKNDRVAVPRSDTITSMLYYVLEPKKGLHVGVDKESVSSWEVIITRRNILKNNEYARDVVVIHMKQ